MSQLFVSYLVHRLDAVSNLVAAGQGVAHAGCTHGLPVANHRRVRHKGFEAVGLQFR